MSGRPRLSVHRWDFIAPYVKDKDVLDIGPAELIGTDNRHKEERALHNLIRSTAGSVVGLEKNQEQVTALQARGYNIRHGDAESFHLDQQFDVVVAGELIEHLSNPGLFLDCVRDHLRPGGKLVLTTPNRFAFVRFLSLFLRNSIPEYDKPIAKHVAYYDAVCLRDLLTRHSYGRFEFGNYEWVGERGGSLKAAPFRAVTRRLRPRFAAGLMVAAEVIGDPAAGASQ